MVPYDRNEGLARKLDVEYLPTYFVYVEDGSVTEDEVKRFDAVEQAVAYAHKLKGKP
jgi:hypothetical protein